MSRDESAAQATGAEAAEAIKAAEERSRHLFRVGDSLEEKCVNTIRFLAVDGVAGPTRLCLHASDGRNHELELQPDRPARAPRPGGRAPGRPLLPSRRTVERSTSRPAATASPIPVTNRPATSGRSSDASHESSMRRRLLPLAYEGLDRWGVDAADRDRAPHDLLLRAPRGAQGSRRPARRGWWRTRVRRRAARCCRSRGPPGWSGWCRRPLPR